MRFTVDQLIEASPEATQAALVDPGFFQALGQMPSISAPEVLDRQELDGTVTMRMRYRFTGELAPAARAVLDPAKLTWIQESSTDLAARTTTVHMVPEHYGQRLRFSGTYRLEEAGEGRTNQHLEAELRVRWPLVGAVVERAIVGGLRDHLAEEAAILQRWLSSTA